MPDLMYKGANVSSVQYDDNDGTIRALVSVTGIVDNVKDIIAPGAYEKSLVNRIPKGVWQHQWTESIAKTNAIKELPPGDPQLPEKLANGQPWPAEAGGLLVDMEFNLKTSRGRDAYEDVKFYGNQQEWSIGYSVPAGGATMDTKTGVRTIHQLDLYEYSPVLFGAMSNARTTSVKSAQNAMLELKSIFGDDAGRVLNMAHEILSKSDDPDKDHDDDDEDDLEDINEETDKEEKGDSAMGTVPVSRDLVVKAVEALQALVGYTSEETQEEKSLYDLMDTAGLEGKILDTADEFDEAIDTGDIALAEKSAMPLLEVVEAMVTMDGIDSKTAEDYQTFATYIGESLVGLQEKSGAPDDDEDDDLEDIEDDEDDATDAPKDKAKDEAKSFERVVTRERNNSFVIESKSLMENDGLSLFGDVDDEDLTF